MAKVFVSYEDASTHFATIIGLENARRTRRAGVAAESIGP